MQCFSSTDLPHTSYLKMLETDEIVKKKKVSNKEAFLRACNFCAYQERTQQEVRRRLHESYIISRDEVEELIARLIEENFVNEERFAKAFAGGKFRVKRWGRIKIKNELRLRGLSNYCINEAMKEIEEEDYMITLERILEKKAHSIKEKNVMKKKYAVATFAQSKGYESNLIWELLENIDLD